MTVIEVNGYVVVKKYTKHLLKTSHKNNLDRHVFIRFGFKTSFKDQ